MHKAPENVFDLESETQRFFIGSLLIAAGLAYVGYELGDKGAALDERMKEANKHLASIADSAKRIADDADAIVDLLKHLPAQIAQIIEQRDITNAVADALTEGQRLSDIIKTSDLIKKYQGEIDSRLVAMTRAINLVVQYRGISGLVLMTSHLAVYTQANDVYQRWLKAAGQPFINPLSASFHVTTVVATWQKALDWDDQFYRNYGNWWGRILRPSNFPGEAGNFASAWKYQHTPERKFVRGGGSYDTHQANTFGLTPLPGFNNPIANPPAYTLTSPRQVPNTPVWVWDTIKTDGQGHPDPQHVSAAQQFLLQGTFGGVNAPKWPIAESFDYVRNWSADLPALRKKLATTMFLAPEEWPGLFMP